MPWRMATMRAMVISRFGGPEVLEVRDVPRPEPALGQVRVRVMATAVNRADLLQCAGLYPAPADSPSDIPGLEVAGEVEALGPGVTDWQRGDRVMAVVGGGGYAEAVVVPSRTLARVPEGLGWVEAAAIPEAFVTAYDAMVLQAGLGPGDTVLIHAAGSGVGTAAVQIARIIGAQSIGTARSTHKLEQARELGLTHGVVPSESADGPQFADRVVALTSRGRGVDVVLDLVGGAYVSESLRALRDQGRLVLVGLVAGRRADIDLSLVLRQRLQITGTVLRSRPLEQKIVAARILDHSLQHLFASRALRPVVDRVLPFHEAPEALRYVAGNASFGKVVLTTDCA